MTVQALLTMAIFMIVLVACALPLAAFMSRIAKPAPINGWTGLAERGLYRLAGVKQTSDMPWTRYIVSLLLFNALGVVVTYLIQRLQNWLPFNPQSMVNVSADSAVNAAVSFVTNTDWQAYTGESTMSYFTQMVAFSVQNFFSRRYRNRRCIRAHSWVCATFYTGNRQLLG